MNDLALAFLTVILVALAFVVPTLLKRRTVRRQAFERHSAVFFQKAEALIGDQDTPAEVIHGFGMLSDSVGRTDGGWMILSVFLRRDPAADDPTTAEYRAEFDNVIAPFLQARPELGRAFNDGVAAWVHAIACNANGLGGWLARRLLKNVLGLVDPAILARRMSRRKRNHDDHTGSAPAHA